VELAAGAMEPSFLWPFSALQGRILPRPRTPRIRAAGLLGQSCPRGL